METTDYSPYAYQPTLTARGEAMPDTKGSWQYLSDQYARVITEQKEEISRLKIKINKLEQSKGSQ
jgi:hypothetical protein